ncbi:MAG: phosphoribosylglycinamide formyltransferase [Pseudomonadota bacterium]
MTRIQVGILISGRGSNMEALVRAMQAPEFPAEPALVLSNRPEAAGLDIAASLGVETAAIDHKPFGKDREAFEREVDAALRRAGVELVALAGFMRVLTPWFVSQWRGRLINIHPSLLPKHKGIDTHARALEAGDTEAGCTVHFVNEGVDDGEIIDQARVPIVDGDTPETLAARVLVEEHKLYPRALLKVCVRLSAG